MAMNTPDLNRSPMESALGLGAGRQNDRASLADLGADSERPAFADVLREASRPSPRRPLAAAEPLQRPRTPETESREPELRPIDRGPAPTSRRRERPDAAAAEEDTAAPEAAAEEAAENPEAAAAAAVQAVAPIVAEAEAADGESTSRPTASPSARPWQAPADASRETAPIRAAGEGQVRLALAGTGEVPVTPAEGGQPDRSGFDLLSPQELLDPDIQVETEGGEMMERLQQALAAGNHRAVDELGEPVVPQVVRSMAALVRNDVTEMRLQLQPRDLGEIEMRVRAVEGIVRGEVMVQSMEVKQLLESQIERLRAALEQQGLRLESLDVGVSEDGAFARDGQGEDENNTPLFGRPGAGTRSEPEDADAGRVGVTPPSQPLRLDPDAVDWLV